MKPKTPIEAVNQLEDFLLADISQKEEWDSEFIIEHFEICREQIEKLKENEKEK